MFKAVANSTAALKSMWGSFGALGGGFSDEAIVEIMAHVAFKVPVDLPSVKPRAK